MNSILRQIGKPALEVALPWAEHFTGFRTARGDYLPFRLQMLTGRYEAEELALMRPFLRPGHTVLDVGANIGYTTRFLGQSVGQRGRVHAFEPNPLIFSLLKENTKNLPQVKVHNLGLSSDNGEHLLFLAGNNHSVASFSETYPATHLAHRGESLAKVSARTVRGDDFLKEEGIAWVNVIKIDVEGWELSVLAGLEDRILASGSIAIFCEFNPAAQKCAGHDPLELLQWFFDHKFALAYPENEQLRPLSSAQVSHFMERMATRDFVTLFASR